MVESSLHPSAMLMAVGLLTLVGLGTVLFVLLRTRGSRVRPGPIVRTLLAAVWLVPAVAATGYAVRQAVPHLASRVAEVPPHDGSLIRIVSLDGRDRPLSVRLDRPVEIRSRPWPTPEEAVADARRRAQRVVDEAFRPAYPYKVAWTVPESVLERAVAGQSVARTEHSTETSSFQMHVAHVTLDLSPAVREAYARAWQARLADVRLVTLGGLVALAVVIVTVAAAYFRLDLATEGAYRRRLKLAAVSLIVAGGLALPQILPDGTAPRPAEPGESIVRTIG